MHILDYTFWNVIFIELNNLKYTSRSNKIFHITHFKKYFLYFKMSNLDYLTESNSIFQIVQSKICL